MVALGSAAVIAVTACLAARRAAGWAGRPAFAGYVATLLGAACGGGAAVLLFLQHFKPPHASAKRIILIRHGESMGNVDVSTYVRGQPDALNRLPASLPGASRACRPVWPTTASRSQTAAGSRPVTLGGASRRSSVTSPSFVRAEKGAAGVACCEVSPSSTRAAVFVSPSERTRETFAELRSQLSGNRVLKAREVGGGDPAPLDFATDSLAPALLSPGVPPPGARV